MTDWVPVLRALAVLVVSPNVRENFWSAEYRFETHNLLLAEQYEIVEAILAHVPYIVRS